MTNVSVMTNVFATTKYIFCRDKSMFVATKLLSPQKDFVANKTSVTTNICHNKHDFVVTKDVFCCDKHVSVVTKVCLSWQNCVCCDKYLSQQKLCHDKHMFGTTNIILSRQKFCLHGAGLFWSTTHQTYTYLKCQQQQKWKTAAAKTWRHSQNHSHARQFTKL